MHLNIPPEIHEPLKAWARWCRGSYLPGWFVVLCQSAERGYLPPAGEVFTSVEDSLRASLGRQERPDMGWLEVRVMRLPERPRMALRLHYVAHKQIPLAHKMRVLGVGEDGYCELIEASARQALDISRERPRIPVATIGPS